MTTTAALAAELCVAESSVRLLLVMLADADAAVLDVRFDAVPDRVAADVRAILDRV